MGVGGIYMTPVQVYPGLMSIDMTPMQIGMTLMTVRSPPMRIRMTLMAVRSTPMRIRMTLMAVRSTPVRTDMGLGAIDATLVQTRMRRLQARAPTGQLTWGRCRPLLGLVTWDATGEVEIDDEDLNDNLARGPGNDVVGPPQPIPSATRLKTVTDMDLARG